MARSFKYVSILNYVSAVRVLHKMYGFLAPPPDDFLVKTTLLGAKRLLGDTSFSSDPLMPSHLVRIRSVLDMSNSEHFVFWAAVVLAFRGLLRKSNFCVGHNSLLRCDVEFQDWGLILWIRNSKTIQYRECVHKVPIASVSGPLCAVSLLHEL